MTVTLFGAIVVCLALYLAIHDVYKLFGLTICLMPFGMAAVVVVGGLSIIAASAVSAIMVMALVARIALAKPSQFWQVSESSLILLLFFLYALFSIIVPLQVFEGKFLVFPLSRGAEGFKVSELFPSTVSHLGFGASNISQFFYIGLSFATFCAVRYLVSERFVFHIHKSLLICVSINILLGGINLVGLDVLMAPVKTATYMLHADHYVLGFRRIIGGFSEASAYSSFSVVLAAYCLVYGLVRRRNKEIVLGLLQTVFALLSFSSTGYFGLACLLLCIFFWVFTKAANGGHSRLESIFANSILLIGLLFFLVFLLFPTMNDIVMDLINSLFISKRESLSGLERKAWADYSLTALWETYGLGAGVGSIRSNGIFYAIVGSMGIPGLAIFLWFLKAIFSDVIFYLKSEGRGENYSIVCAVTVAFIVQIAMQAVSNTTPDPGLLFVILAGLLSGLCRRSKQELAKRNYERIGTDSAGFQKRYVSE